ncbi:MAG: hypothetical protein NW220_22580 [Leptolyngbyaceae cyanobacterium bins.349]|nr:hypothetical protein [Leptolyngbyaceae cyanobacterium bins.349]
MYPLSGANRDVVRSSPHVVNIARSDRWPLYHRLQELMIPCWCLPDGTLQVDIQDGLSAWLLWSVVRQFSASRQDLVTWLNQCWDVPL